MLLTVQIVYVPEISSLQADVIKTENFYQDIRDYINENPYRKFMSYLMGYNINKPPSEIEIRLKLGTNDTPPEWLNNKLKIIISTNSLLFVFDDTFKKTHIIPISNILFISLDTKKILVKAGEK